MHRPDQADVPDPAHPDGEPQQLGTLPRVKGAVETVGADTIETFERA